MIVVEVEKIIEERIGVGQGQDEWEWVELNEEEGEIVEEEREQIMIVVIDFVVVGLVDLVKEVSDMNLKLLMH